MTTGKTIALTIWIFVSNAMSLFFNMLPKFVIVFLPRSERLLISWLQSVYAVILELKKTNSFTVLLFPARRSNKPILKKINSDYTLEGLMLKLQYFSHLMLKTASLEKTLMLGKIEGRKRRGQQRMFGWHHWLNGHEFEQVLGDSEGQERLVCCSHKESDMNYWLTNNSKAITDIKNIF